MFPAIDRGEHTDLGQVPWGTPEPTIGEEPLEDGLDRVEEGADTVEPSPQDQRDLVRVHRTMGHPRNEDLARTLRHAGVRSHLIRWARKELRCPECEARPRPLARRPAMLPRSVQFNMVVGTDLCAINFRGEQVWCSNTVCWGTGWQVVSRLPSGKTSRGVRDDFVAS